MQTTVSSTPIYEWKDPEDWSFWTPAVLMKHGDTVTSAHFDTAVRVASKDFTPLNIQHPALDVLKSTQTAKAFPGTWFGQEVPYGTPCLYGSNRLGIMAGRDKKTHKTNVLYSWVISSNRYRVTGTSGPMPEWAQAVASLFHPGSAHVTVMSMPSAVGKPRTDTGSETESE